MWNLRRLQKFAGNAAKSNNAICRYVTLVIIGLSMHELSKYKVVVFIVEAEAEWQIVKDKQEQSSHCVYCGRYGKEIDFYSRLL